MSTTLADFLIDLSQNPAKLRAFRRDPETLATAAGLSPAERSALEHRDPRAIRSLMGQIAEPVPRPVFVQSTVFRQAASA